VSLDLSNRHAAAGAGLDVPVWVMSDRDDANGDLTVDVMLLDKHPGFDWDGKTTDKAGPVHVRKSFRCAIEPWQVRQEKVSIRMPAAEGSYTLAAALREGDGPARAVSLRPIKVFAPLPAPVRKLSVAVIEKDGRIAAWLKQRGHNVVLPWGYDRPDVLVIGEGMQNDASLRGYGFALANRVKLGGMRLVVLEQQAWAANGMSANIFEGLTSAALRVPVEWVFPDDELRKDLGGPGDFDRLNGCDHIALRVRLEIPKAAAASAAAGTGQPNEMISTSSAVSRPASAPASGPAGQSPWGPLMKAFSQGEKNADWAMVRRRFGAGEVFACQVPLADRLDGAKVAEYDPVAERIFAWLIEGPLAEK
jgi:hypothetical protein